MSRLELPPRVREEIQLEKWVAQRAEMRALVTALLDFDDPVCLEWNPVVQEADRRLRLGRARPKAFHPALPVKPGFYHWVCDNDNAAPTVAPITDPEGGFKVPDSSLLDVLRSNDLQNPKVFRQVVEAHARAEAAREVREQQDHEDRVESMVDRYRALTTASVSMNRDTPWHQNMAGRKGVKR